MSHQVKTLVKGLSLPDGNIYPDPNTVVTLTDDEYLRIDSLAFTRGLLQDLGALGSTGTQMVIRQGYVTDGSGNPLPNTAGSWIPLSGFELPIPAVVGDWVEIGVHAMRHAVATALLDVGVIVGTGIVRFMATGTNSAPFEGDPGFYIDQNLISQSASRGFSVTTNDLDGGHVRFAMVTKAQGTGILRADSNYPFYWMAKNYGQITVP